MTDGRYMVSSLIVKFEGEERMIFRYNGQDNQDVVRHRFIHYITSTCQPARHRRCAVLFLFMITEMSKGVAECMVKINTNIAESTDG